MSPIAGYEGEIVAANVLRGNRRTADFTGIVSVVNAFGIAMRHNISADALAESLVGYPSGLSDLEYMLG